MAKPASFAAGQLRHLVAHLAHYLPAQGPIGVFIHHNTLHAFQHLPFEQAVTDAARLFQAEPYMAERDYQAAFAAGRIQAEDVAVVLTAEARDIDLRRVMLIPGLRHFAPETIQWELHEKGLASAFRPDLPAAARAALAGESAPRLFDFWLRIATAQPSKNGSIPAKPVRPRDGILAQTGIDVDDAIHPLLIKLASAFLDQGMAYWPMPNRDEGFWLASVHLLSQRGGISESCLRALPSCVNKWVNLDAESAIEAGLAALGVPESDREEFLKAELLALPGWPGLMHQLEADPALFPHEAVPASLVDFLAVRMLLTVTAATSVMGSTRDWATTGISPKAAQAQALTATVAAARCFDAAQLLGLGQTQLAHWTPRQLNSFQDSVLAFDEWERRRLWHAAYELRHERQILLPLQQHHASQKTPRSSTWPKLPVAHVFFCIDEREESIRRHLEEIDPEIETLGAAGFFGVAMNYTGIDDANGVSLCPVVVKPQHAIAERAAPGQEGRDGRRQALRRAWAKVARHAFISSRTLVRGWLGATLLGLFSFFPMAARVLSPRHYARLMSWLNASVLPEPRTELAFMRSDEVGLHQAEGLLNGFTLAEKADRVAGMLIAAGLPKGMARLVVVLGHGSTSLNNPHESAHDCGACGGRRGGPNARIFAAMANHPRVRQELRSRGVIIGDDTWFIGGYHDTCNDDVDLYDLEQLPASHLGDLARVRRSLDAARSASALERARRFEAASNSRQSIDGLHHVQERAEHLAEPRPEYGHCTNAVCFVGRRALTRGLFYDRRAFLVSYDATQDSANESLGRILGAVVPVCGGISLEYYFSFVDNERYGCGTKLPHNVTGLVGVMNGYESDLRTGLPWQMVEIHEPVRILFVVETTPERVLATFRANPGILEFLDNRWVRLAAVDPADPTRIHVYRGGDRWEAIEGTDEKLAHAATSLAWYHGHREHLGVARIQAGSQAA